MKETVTYYKNGFIQPFIIFSVSIIVYLFYYAGTYPGYYSQDVMRIMHGFMTAANGLEAFKYCNTEFLDVSFFYAVYVSAFFLITKNLVSLGLFQIVFASAIVTYCWIILVKYAKVGVAWIVTLLMIVSPLNGLMNMWYHRSSLFAYIVCLNLLLLYKFSKVRRFEHLENIVFFINLILISSIRFDGIIISLSSLFVYSVTSKDLIRERITLCAGFLLVVILFNLGTGKSEDRFYLAFPLAYQVRRVKQNAGREFTDNDLKVLKALVPEESHRKLWLETEEQLDPVMYARDTNMNRHTPRDIVTWSTLFIVNNFIDIVKSQAKVFLDSSYVGSPVSGYFHTNESNKENIYFAELQSKIDIRDRHSITFVSRIVHFLDTYLYEYFSSHPYSFITFLLFGTFIPFVFVFVYFFIACAGNKNVLIPLIPLLCYCSFMFLFQPQPKAYYWYWLAYSYYFIVFGLGYDLIEKKRALDASAFEI